MPRKTKRSAANLLGQDTSLGFSARPNDEGSAVMVLLAIFDEMMEANELPRLRQQVVKGSFPYRVLMPLHTRPDAKMWKKVQNILDKFHLRTDIEAGDVPELNVLSDRPAAVVEAR